MKRTVAILLGFSFLICLLLVAAMVGDLVFLPAMLTGRVGKRVFPERE